MNANIANGTLIPLRGVDAPPFLSSKLPSAFTAEATGLYYMDTDRIPMAQTTTIKISAKTRDALQSLKGNHSYDELMTMLLKLVPEGDDEGRFTPDFRRSLLEGLLYRGPRLTHDQVKRELGIA